MMDDDNDDDDDDDFDCMINFSLGPGDREFDLLETL